MCYWIHLVVCERSILCCIVYRLYCVFRIPHVFFFFFWHSNNLTKPTQRLKKIWKKLCKGVLDFYMKIINNKHTLLYIRPTIHSIQRYNGLCELTKYIPPDEFVSTHMGCEFFKIYLPSVIKLFVDSQECVYKRFVLGKKTYRPLWCRASKYF